MRSSIHIRCFIRVIAIGAVVGLLSGCYVFNFFKKSHGDDDDTSEAVFTGSVIGQPLGDKASGPDAAALASIYAISAAKPPAALRPDPDLFIRRMLRQYRPEGATVAQQIGSIEPYRQLLGGATEDFSKSPQEEYDATSLLAVFKVAQEVCYGLVAPTAFSHPGWSTILPYPPEYEAQNIEWLALRFIGMPAARVDPSVYNELYTIMITEQPTLTLDERARNNAYAKYVPVCATLALDAEALYL